MHASNVPRDGKGLTWMLNSNSFYEIYCSTSIGHEKLRLVFFFQGLKYAKRMVNEERDSTCIGLVVENISSHILLFNGYIAFQTMAFGVASSAYKVVVCAHAYGS